MNSKQRIQELREVLRKYNYQYYMLDSPTISDFEFDKLLEELIALESEHPELEDPNSPSKRVGGAVSKKIQ